MFLLAWTTGCGGPGPSAVTGPEPDGDQVEVDSKPSRESPSPQASLAKIRRLIASGDASAAMRAVQAHLLRYPDDAGAMVLASGVLNGQGRVDEAVTMLDSAARLSAEEGWKWRQRAASMLAHAQRPQEAIDRLESLIDERGELDDVRHELVAILNRRGFRFDANEHVRTLCRRGKATADELRGLMFPARSFAGLTEKPSVADVDRNRTLGELNVARAMYGEGDVTEASQVLQTSRLVAQRHPEAMAFYGQMLIESQRYDVFDDWLGMVPPESQRYPGYWMALGGWAMRQREFDRAVGRFAEAVLREPGDLAATDRIRQALSAGGHSSESDRFRARGVLIDRSRTITRQLFSGAAFDPAAIDELSRLLTDAGRPLEALAWYRIALVKMGSPAGAVRQLDQALAMADRDGFERDNRRKVLCGIDVDRFPSDVRIADFKRADVPINDQPAEQPRDAAVEPEFTDIASQVGLEFTYYNAPTQRRREFRLHEQLGAGVACIDYDLDGHVDIYLGQASGDPPKGLGTRPNLLARSLGDRLITVTEIANADDRGFTFGITAGDWNQDGFPDLVVGNLMRNTLLINQGDGTFAEQSGDSGWQQPRFTTSLAMGDVNGDALPDLVEVNYVDDPRVYDPIRYNPDGTPVRLPAPLDFRPSHDRVFLSVGDGSLAGQTIDGDGQVAPATGLGVVLTDLDGDRRNEIFVANDRLANHLWQRAVAGADEDDHWHNMAAVRGVAFGANGTPQGCMGIAVADFDFNGRPDLHVTNFEKEWNNQYMQDRDGFFDDVVVASGLDQPTYEQLGFGVQALDYDNNGGDDLVIGNGHVEDYSHEGRAFRMPTMVFSSEQSRFVAKEVGGDPEYWQSGHLSRALATCDWNNDGRVDFVMTDLLEPVALLENRTPTPYHWLQIQLVGTTAERDAIGASIEVSMGDGSLTKVVSSGDGYLCRNQPLVCFGLGKNQIVTQLEVHWPGGEVQRFENVAVDRRLVIVQSQRDLFELTR